MDCYFFVDNDGTENVSNIPPKKHPSEPFWIVTKEVNGKEKIVWDAIVELPRNTIHALFGVHLDWNSNPIKITWGDISHRIE